MSTESESEWAEFMGVDPWESETSERKFDYPEPEHIAGAVVACPECGSRMARGGFPTHWRRTCSPNTDKF